MTTERGISLLELLIVVSILGIAAAVAVPGVSNTDPYQLELAADEIAQALRFARSESIRTGESFGVSLNPSTRQIRVFRSDRNTNPATADYRVYQPVTKKTYLLDFSNHPFARVDSMSVVPLFRATCDTPSLVRFDAHGSVWCGISSGVLLTGMAISITTGGKTVTVSLDGITGRTISP
jgi:prepilin-type N-terminal cleavage/methylation domain-containing protein